ncbi:hypothetical protein OOJ09_28865 [Mesorhizobium qingshengii]|uniref:Uncharacterized protein n=1 Tax=Mesorhizobium qingshengii TaxID=1165689 RepID=A0ABT4R2Z0_9HYPH|nr:hypothetical protein [Mesorhizobium qingshengii]MCZ8548204.1 hypothetical protein [Mesorhizobium qingshengii]
MVNGLRHQPNFRITARDQKKAVKPLSLSQLEQEGNGAVIVGAGPRHLPISVTRETRQRGIGAHQPDRHLLRAKAPGQRQRAMRPTKNDNPGGPTFSIFAHLHLREHRSTHLLAPGQWSVRKQAD